MKVRRGGVGTHFCIHKYFFDRNPSWKAIRDEATQAEDLQKNGNLDAAVLDEEEAGVNATALKFTPIDARHLSSLPLISARVVKLLKASKNFIHASNNMLITLVSVRKLFFHSETSSFWFYRGFLIRLKPTAAFFRVESAK